MSVDAKGSNIPYYLEMWRRGRNGSSLRRIAGNSNFQLGETRVVRTSDEKSGQPAVSVTVFEEKPSQ